MSERTSNISIRGEEHRPIRVMVSPAGAGVLVWVDDAGDGCPLANIRLTEDDARKLIGRLGQALATEVIPG